MLKLAQSALVSLLLALPVATGCSADAGEDGNDHDDNEGETAATEEALSSDVSCDRESMAAYQGGSRIGTVDTIKIGGKRTTLKTGQAFLKLQKLAAARGIDIWINSGFRTMSEQTYFWNCYQNGNCNNGNKAARPGYSNHQNGRALDIGTSNRSGLNRLIDNNNLDWRLTVPGEAWHYEYFGATVAGPCDGNGQTDDGDNGDNGQSSGGCFSPTLNTHVAENTCVQGRSNSIWYQCHSGAWDRGVTGNTGPHGACASVHPL
jgi:hypothetical protein